MDRMIRCNCKHGSMRCCSCTLLIDHTCTRHACMLMIFFKVIYFRCSHEYPDMLNENRTMPIFLGRCSWQRQRATSCLNDIWMHEQ